MTDVGTLHSVAQSHTRIAAGVFQRLRARYLGFDFFISYAHADALGYAMALENSLRALDFSCFRDAREMPLGSYVRETIKLALSRSRVLIVVATKGATTSTWVAEEVATFVLTGRQILVAVVLEVRLWSRTAEAQRLSSRVRVDRPWNASRSSVGAAASGNFDSAGQAYRARVASIIPLMACLLTSNSALRFRSMVLCTSRATS